MTSVNQEIDNLFHVKSQSPFIWTVLYRKVTGSIDLQVDDFIHVSS